MPTPRSLLIFDSYPDLIGGNQRYICMLMKYGRGSKWRVSLASAGEGMYIEAARATGADVHIIRQPDRLGWNRRDILNAGVVDKIGIAFSILLYNIRMFVLLRRLKPDIVQCHSTRNALMTGLAIKLARIPMVLFVKGEMQTPMLDGLMLRLADHVMFISDSLRPARYRRLFEKHPERFSLLRIGVDRHEIDAVIRRTAKLTPQDMGMEPGTVNFAFAGILIEAKGVHILIPAFEAVARRHPECRLHILGTSTDEPYKQLLNQQVEKHGLTNVVKFHGWRDDALDLLAVADAFVMPSFAEGTPRSVVEAMALGTPVVATRVGGVPELLDNGRIGLIAEPRDRASLEAAMLDIAGDAALRTRLGNAGLAEVRARYTFDAHLKTLWATLDEVRSAPKRGLADFWQRPAVNR